MTSNKRPPNPGSAVARDDEADHDAARTGTSP